MCRSLLFEKWPLRLLNSGILERSIYGYLFLVHNHGSKSTINCIVLVKQYNIKAALLSTAGKHCRSNVIKSCQSKQKSLCVELPTSSGDLFLSLLQHPVNRFLLTWLSGPGQSLSRHVRLWRSKTPTSGCGGDFWSKNIYLKMVCDDTVK